VPRADAFDPEWSAVAVFAADQEVRVFGVEFGEKARPLFAVLVVVLGASEWLALVTHVWAVLGESGADLVANEWPDRGVFLSVALGQFD